MKKKKIFLLSSLFIILFLLFYLFLIPFINDRACKDRIFNDLISKVDNMKKSVIGIIPEEKQDNYKNHNGLGSGVIFDKIDNTYYALTAAHVLNEENASYKVFTINTNFSGEVYKIDDKVSFEIPDDNYYDSLLNIKVEYISQSADLAIISFNSNDNLPIMEIETNKVNIGDRIIAIGHPVGNKYVTTYGYIKSDLKNITLKNKTTNDKKTDKIIEHNAYLNFGNSGGVAISDNLKIVGINIGGSFNIFGYYDKGYMIPNNIILDNINAWKSNNNL